MEKMNHICKLASSCKKAGTDACNVLCSPFILLHGLEGHTGLWRARNVPKKYENSFLSNLPIQQDNPLPFSIIRRYVGSVIDNVRNGTGLFLYSIPNAENRLGTGTGKTTSAIAVANEYLLARTLEHSKGGEPIVNNPVLYYKASEFQNLYNAQFKGTPDMKDAATRKYERVKKLMMKVELLVFDDIGIRQKITDNFENELTEIIDGRDSDQLATIYTSNLPIDKLADTLGDRITSRIDGMTVSVAFKGKDHRKGGLL